MLISECGGEWSYLQLAAYHWLFHRALYWVQSCFVSLLTNPYERKDFESLEHIQRREVGSGLEHTSDASQLRELGELSVEKRRLRREPSVSPQLPDRSA